MSNQIFPLLEAFNRHLNNALHILNSGAFIINRLKAHIKVQKNIERIRNSQSQLKLELIGNRR